MNDESRVGLTDLVRLIAAIVVVAVWIGIVIFNVSRNRATDFGVHAICGIAAGYLFASPVGKAINRLTGRNNGP